MFTRATGVTWPMILKNIAHTRFARDPHPLRGCPNLAPVVDNFSMVGKDPMVVFPGLSWVLYSKVTLGWGISYSAKKDEASAWCESAGF